jgi:ubiquitin-protein ligase
MRAHKFTNITDLKIASAKRHQTFGTARLLREVRELETNPFPFVNLSAKPSENNVYEWKILMAGPVGSLYEGLFLKLLMTLPQNYPICPPTRITIVDSGSTPLLHPNIQNNNICIENFALRKEKLEGWNTLYTLRSVFQQLEGFLWEGHDLYKIEQKKALEEQNLFVANKQLADEKARKERKQRRIREIKDWNRRYNYDKTKHKTYEEEYGHIEKEENKPKDYGKCYLMQQWEQKEKKILNVIDHNKDLKYGDYKGGWSPIIPASEIQDEEFQNPYSAFEIIRDNLFCFYTKLGAEESPLGLGMKITRIPRTGQVKEAESSEELLSLRAFIKKGVRRTLKGHIFGYWIPVYLGIQKERTLHLAKRSFSFIMTTKTDQFEPIYAAKVMMKAISTTLIHIAVEKEDCSVKTVRKLIWYHTLLLMFCREFPEITAYIDQTLEDFLESDEKRHKKHSSDLSLILCAIIFSDKYTWKDLIETYFKEQLCRQVMWILKKIPELEDDTNTLVIDENRVEVTFATQIISYKLTTVFHNYNKILREMFKTPMTMLEILEKRCCLLTEEQEAEVYENIELGMENMINYDEYFAKIQMEKKTTDELVGCLKTAVQESKRKKYHGNPRELIDLPPLNQQVIEYLERKLDLSDIMNGGSCGNEKKDTPSFKMLDKIMAEKTGDDDQKWKQLTEEDWKELCFQRWQWVRDLHCADPGRNFGPAKIAKAKEAYDEETFIEPTERKDAYFTVMKPQYNPRKSPKQYYGGAQEFPADYTWRQLFTKFDLEEHMFSLVYHKDFKGLHKKLDNFGDEVSQITMFVTSTQGITSGYYYVLAMLNKMKGLKSITVRPKKLKGALPMNFLVNFIKGIDNLTKAGGSIESLRFKNIKFDMHNSKTKKQMELIDKMIGVLENSLSSFTLDNCNLFKLEMTFEEYINRNNKKEDKYKERYFTFEMKNLKELNLIKAVEDNVTLYTRLNDHLKKRNIEHFKFSKNVPTSNAEKMILDLCFWQSLTTLDLSEFQFRNAAKIGEAMFKLLLVSKKIEYLSLEKTPIFSGLKHEFFKALGIHPSLKILNLSSSNSGSSAYSAMYLAYALAINGHKNLPLEELYLDNVINDSSSSIYFNRYLTRSDNLEETWYSWYGTLHKADKGLYSDKDQRVCKLKVLTMDFCQLAYPEEMFTTMRDLEVFSMAHSSFSNGNWNAVVKKYKELEKKDKPYLFKNLKYINVSGFAMNSSNNADMFVEVLKKLPNLESIIATGCQFSTNHANKICKALANHKNIATINLYKNKIGVRGAKVMFELANKVPSLKFIDVGFNQVGDQGLKGIAKELSTNTSLSGFSVRYNNISSSTFSDFFKTISSNESSALNSMFFKGNHETSFHFDRQIALVESFKKHFFVDFFYRAALLDSERIERTLWVEHKGNFTMEQAVSHFAKHRTGMVVNARFRYGEQYETVGEKQDFLIVEFANPKSLELAMLLPGKGQNKIGAKRVRFYRAGTATFYYSKYCKSNKYLKGMHKKIIWSAIGNLNGQVDQALDRTKTKKVSNRVRRAEKNIRASGRGATRGGRNRGY